MPFGFGLKACASVGGFDDGGEASDGRFCDVAGEGDAATLLGLLDFYGRQFFRGQVNRANIFGQVEDGWWRTSVKQSRTAGQSKLRDWLNEGVGLAVLEAHIHKPVVQLFDGVRP